VSSIEEAIVSRLGSDAGVDAIIDSDDIHAMIAPEGTQPPYIVYQLISGPEMEIAEYWRPRFQLACWSPTYAGAVALAHAVRSCFYNRHLTVLGVHFRSWIENVMDGNQEPELGRFCRIVDVRFVYRNPT
jgi:hypothetical protein